MKIRKFLAGLTLSILASTAYAGYYDAGYYEGVKAYEKKDYKLAWQKFAPLAKQGIARAQAYIAAMYEFGLGVKEDINEAEMWKKIAAKAALEEATHIGNLYGTQASVLGLGELCAIAKEFPVGKIEIEEELVGQVVHYELTATGRSKTSDTMWANEHYKDCTACETVDLTVAIHNANATSPRDLDANDNFIVKGRITSAAIWANAFEGCFIHVDATGIEKNGF